MQAPTVLFVPGLRGRVADHWQTLMAAELPGSRTVPPLAENGLGRTDRVAALAAAVAAIDGPVVLAAHSAGCLMVAHWVAAGGGAGVAGALLATPADIERQLPPGYPTLGDLSAGGWLPIPRRAMPFPTIVALSDNDPLASGERIQCLADDWGARLERVGAVGHLNPAAGFGPWPRGRRLLDGLLAAVPT